MCIVVVEVLCDQTVSMRAWIMKFGATIETKFPFWTAEKLVALPPGGVNCPPSRSVSVVPVAWANVMVKLLVVEAAPGFPAVTRVMSLPVHVVPLNATGLWARALPAEARSRTRNPKNKILPVFLISKPPWRKFGFIFNTHLRSSSRKIDPN